MSRASAGTRSDSFNSSGFPDSSALPALNSTPATFTFSSFTLAGLRRSAVTVTGKLAPGVVLGFSATASAYSPTLATIASSSSASFWAFHGFSGSRRSSRRAASRPGRAASGDAARKASRARRSSATSCAVPGTRDQSRTRPSNGEPFIGSPPRGRKNSFEGPRRRAAPKPWLLWLLRLSAASSP